MSEKEALWRERLTAWQTSGHSLRGFALQNGWRPRQLVYWRNRLAQPIEATSMIPVEVTSPAAAPITLCGPNGWSVQLSGPTPAAWLAELLRAL